MSPRTPPNPPERTPRPRIGVETEAGRAALEAISDDTGGSYTAVVEVSLQFVAEGLQAGRWKQTPDELARRIRRASRERVRQQGRRG